MLAGPRSGSGLSEGSTTVGTQGQYLPPVRAAPCSSSQPWLKRCRMPLVIYSELLQALHLKRSFLEL